MGIFATRLRHTGNNKKRIGYIDIGDIMGTLAMGIFMTLKGTMVTLKGTLVTPREAYLQPNRHIGDII